MEVVRAKMNKANSIITYLAGKTKGMETNTALMLYKSIVRSITDYANFIYYPNTKSLSLKLERAQFQGIRTALGYRNSTPANRKGKETMVPRGKQGHVPSQRGMLQECCSNVPNLAQHSERCCNIPATFQWQRCNVNVAGMLLEHCSGKI
ncbi:hypothetical protein PV326_012856 [Microctonus aethiopoides]|nr:hypothetical protein PV326_012856 [Microctonus aethiopoides]